VKLSVSFCSIFQLGEQGICPNSFSFYWGLNNRELSLAEFKLFHDEWDKLLQEYNYHVYCFEATKSDMLLFTIKMMSDNFGIESLCGQSYMSFIGINFGFMAYLFDFVSLKLDRHYAQMDIYYLFGSILSGTIAGMGGVVLFSFGQRVKSR
jgi:hypothetical protein